MSTLVGLPSSVQYELNDLFVGQLIARGTMREVYEHAFDRSLVIKIETSAARGFANVAEWHVWQTASGYPWVARWYAPCVAISFSGSVMLQRRTTPITELPEELPDFMSDVKCSNFGLLDGNVVAHDYGYHLHMDRSMKKERSIRMVRVSEVDRGR